jgi:hypothetical protein
MLGRDAPPNVHKELQMPGLTLETVINRTEFGLSRNAPLPRRGFAVADDVKLTVELELILS